MKRFSCGEVVELTPAYLDDGLDEPVRLLLEEHLVCCRECGRDLDQFRTVIGALGALPPEPPEGLREDVRDRLMSAFRGRKGH
ncbi:anti-sigma factor family protein [Planobispora takensis]|uniref:Putative zinc-finger domain-containing protein n=1 Tax=Planobispora takensis TaxID=1367882 RepID=A0A8J3WT24_9ACTN|nr:zf-HC2 domain-containing protein [Planobispora takensis]GII01016.1 hypothetical protein Pta02_30240 [Planobispora takensis]